MERAVIVRAEMADGAVIEETAASFGTFVDLVLAFRRDADVRRLVWREEAATASADRAQAA